MKTEDVEYIIVHHKWQFKLSELWNRYFSLLAPLFFIFISIFIVIKTGLKSDGTVSQTSLILFIIVLFLIGIFSFRFTLVRLGSERKFYSMDFTDKQKDQLSGYIRELGWEIIQEQGKYIQANTKISGFSWGEVITIVIEENRILFNSRPSGQPFTFNKDRVNFKKFSNLISQQKK